MVQDQSNASEGAGDLDLLGLVVVSQNEQINTLLASIHWVVELVLQARLLRPIFLGVMTLLVALASVIALPIVGQALLSSRHAGAPSSEPVDKEDREEKTHSSLRLTILVSHTNVECGASVSVQLALVNEGPRDVTVTFTSSQRFDLVVKDAAGHEVFRWSAGMLFAQVIQDAKLRAGGRIEDELAWNADVLPGTYGIVGMTRPMMVDGRTVSLTSDLVTVSVQS
jgi:hypothetical protein